MRGALILLVGCEVSEEAADSVSCGSMRSFTIEYCDACHAATALDRHGAPLDVTFDTEAEAEDRAAQIAARVADGEMPPGGGVTEGEIADVLDWAACVEP